jgi:H+-translocating NAD(P) transhydrogenase subunit beta
MAIAAIATLIAIRHTENWALIIAGLLVGVVCWACPCPADEDDRHALFNGVGGGTVALIALAEFIDTEGFSAFKHGEAPTACTSWSLRCSPQSSVRCRSGAR